MRLRWVWELESRDWAALLEHFVILDDRMFPCHGHDVNVVLIYHEPIGGSSSSWTIASMFFLQCSACGVYHHAVPV